MVASHRLRYLTALAFLSLAGLTTPRAEAQVRARPEGRSGIREAARGEEGRAARRPLGGGGGGDRGPLPVGLPGGGRP